jgi:aspartyl-tRNA(Asn)/glutamyl-tRNA(Gln) amidotransferase subunit A
MQEEIAKDSLQTISEIAISLRSGDTNSEAITTHLLSRIEKYNPSLNAYLTVTPEIAIAQARDADKNFTQGIDRGPLQGVPIAIKDLFATEGIRTTCGSLLFVDWIPDFDATVVTKLKEAGAVILGKTGMHELANGNTSINPHFGAVRNPWARDRDPGGSSGGSAAAVSAGLAYAALGSDTVCSIRQPAHCCGVVGYKPTFGLVSKFGAKPLSWTLDHIGPLTRSVGDSAIILEAIAGYDRNDFYSQFSPKDNRFLPQKINIRGLNLGIMRKFFFEGDSDVIEVVDSALERLQAHGVNIVDLDIPDIESAYDAAMSTLAESGAIYGRLLKDKPDKFSEEQCAEIEWASSITSSVYLDAQYFRQGFTERMEKMMSQCDAFVVPTATLSALPIDNRPEDPNGFSLRNCSIFNLTGQPAISIPCGFTKSGLPVGIMLAGPKFDGQKVISIANAFENCFKIREAV